MTTRQIQRHDHFFQRLLDKPGTAGTLLRERLPEEVAQLLVDAPPVLSWCRDRSCPAVCAATAPTASTRARPSPGGRFSCTL
ncbi:hypothetical protein WCLP8_870005 [uncultured Gammaproteobacteria bacterium]